MRTKQKLSITRYVVRFFLLDSDGTILEQHEVHVEETNTHDAYEAARNLLRRHMNITIPANHFDWAHSVTRGLRQ